MDAVDNMIQKGLQLIKDAIVNFSKKLDLNADTTLLEATQLQCNLNWHLCQSSIVTIFPLSSPSLPHPCL